MPRKFNLPLTYAPKLEPVRSGKCTQTIRIVNHTKAHPEGVKKSEGDLIRFFTWTGKPYRSKREWVTEEYALITYVKKIVLFDWGWQWGEIGFEREWSQPDSDDLAKLDGIVPATGEALRDVLIGKNGRIPAAGVEAQVIKWHRT